MGLGWSVDWFGWVVLGGWDESTDTVVQRRVGSGRIFFHIKNGRMGGDNGSRRVQMPAHGVEGICTIRHNEYRNRWRREKRQKKVCSVVLVWVCVVVRQVCEGRKKLVVDVDVVVQFRRWRWQGGSAGRA